MFEFPTINIEPVADYTDVQAEIKGLSNWDWLIFTSVNGVKHFFNQMDEAGLDARAFAGLEIAAIGPATADALIERGIRPDFVPEKYVAEGVVAGLLEKGIKGKNVLIPRAKVAREVLPEELRKAGAEVKILPVYETGLSENDPGPIAEALEAGKIDYLTFTSSSTVENFFNLIEPEVFHKYKDSVKIACIGPITAKTLEGFGYEPDIQPDDYTIPALVDILVQEVSE